MILSPATQEAIAHLEQQIVKLNSEQPTTQAGQIERTRTVHELQRCLQAVKKGIAIEVHDGATR